MLNSFINRNVEQFIRTPHHYSLSLLLSTLFFFFLFFFFLSGREWQKIIVAAPSIHSFPKRKIRETKIVVATLFMGGHSPYLLHSSSHCHLSQQKALPRLVLFLFLSLSVSIQTLLFYTLRIQNIESHIFDLLILVTLYGTFLLLPSSFLHYDPQPCYSLHFQR